MSATPGAGGWDQAPQGSSATTPALNGSVLALTNDGEGPGAHLLVGGTFTKQHNGYNSSNHFQLWPSFVTGWGWFDQGGLNGAVSTVTHPGPYNTWVGGTFTDAGGDAPTTLRPLMASSGRLFALVCH